MMDLWIILYGTAAGFACAGLLASLHELVTGRRLVFALDKAVAAPQAMLGLLLRLVAGPYLLARTTLDRLRLGQADPLMIALLLALACMWGCLSGVLVVELAGGFTPAAAARP